MRTGTYSQGSDRDRITDGNEDRDIVRARTGAVMRRGT